MTERFYTLGEIAKAAGSKTHRIRYAVQRLALKPTVIVGRVFGFSGAAAADVVRLMRAMKATRAELAELEAEIEGEKTE